VHFGNFMVEDFGCWDINRLILLSWKIFVDLGWFVEIEEITSRYCGYFLVLIRKFSHMCYGKQRSNVCVPSRFQLT
jgi:hypothetical protein